MSLQERHIFCFGHGYTCDYLDHALRARGGWRISGTTRHPEKRVELRNRGINAYLFDDEVHLPDALYILRDVTHILISTPPDDLGDPCFSLYGEDILNLKSLEWIGYLSTTGVYGDRAGGWVDESSEIRPSTKRGSRRAKAEQQWLSLFADHGLAVHVFRLAGIYGPGRSALDSVRAGVARRIDKPGHAFSRIHVEDIVQVLMKSIEKPNAGRAYNVCDDLPAPSHEVIDYACQLLGLPSPPLIPFEKVDLAPITQSFYADNKRINNDRIKSELAVNLKYKNYREGLKACLDAEDVITSSFSGFKK